MTKPIVSAFFCAALLFAGHLTHTDVAVASNADCSRSCISQETDCMEKAKDSPNDIDRELCENERKECLLKCDEEYKKEVEQAEKERVLKEQQEREMLENQGLTVEEQKEEKLKQMEIEREKRREERE